MPKNFLKFIYIFLLSSLFYQPSHADDNLYFYHLGAKNGLSQISIFSIYQDELGAMWFGSTEGVSRYNGVETESFKPGATANGLTQNTIHTICGNQKGTIYLRAEFDLIKYDLHKQQFETIQRHGVRAITYTNKGLLVIIHNKLVRYNDENNVFEDILLLPSDVSVTCILKASDDTILIGTKNGLYFFTEAGEIANKMALENVSITTLFEDSNNNFWIGSSQNGVFKIDQNLNITNYKEHPNANSLSNNQVREIVEDNESNIWIATFYGLNKYNQKEDRWVQYTNDDYIDHSLSHSSIFSLFKDKQGTIWIGTYFGGVNYFNNEVDIFQYYGASLINKNMLSFPYVGSMTEDKHNNLWICTEGGQLNQLDLNNYKLSRYSFDAANKDKQYNQKSIWYRQDKDWLYVGLHNGGLAIFDVATKRGRIIQEGQSPQSLPNNTVNQIQYYNNDLILLTQSGLVKMDINTEKFYPLSNDPEINNILKDVAFNAFLIDSKDRLWAIKKNRNVIQIDLKTNKATEYLAQKPENKSISRFLITDIFESSTGEIYFASMGAGIFRYKQENKTFENYTKEGNGLLSNYCYNISESPLGKLILLHNDGFSYFDPKDPSQILFRSSKNFPLAGFYNGNTVYITKNKEIFIGGINGLVSFREDDVNKIDKEYNIYFDKLLINNTLIKPDDGSEILKESLFLQSKLKLNHDQNNISISFATSNYLQSITHDYEYMLEGFDKNWIKTNSQTISYTNIDPGKYTLKVRELTESGKTNTSPLHSLVIEIDPPFYLSKLAFVIYALIVISLFLIAIKLSIWRTKLKTSLEVAEKEKENIEKLNQSKLSFFTNISHEFRTPLTLIIGQVESLLMNNQFSVGVYNNVVKIHKNAEHLLNLITELLDFSKQEHGSNKLIIKEVDIIPLAKDIYDSFEEYASKKNIEFKLEYSQPSIMLYIDFNQIKKVIYNLLSNAFKYTSDGEKITIKIELRNYDVLLQVIDTGIGIPQEYMDKIFDRFYQIEHRSSGFSLGTGIGLALTREIILAHKGTLEVESKVNKGSIFSVKLMLGTSHFSEDELKVSKLGSSYMTQTLEYKDPQILEKENDSDIQTVVFEDKPTVLLVEDNEALLELLVEAFSKYYNVETAANGEIALEMVLSNQPDLVISDIMMPVMSGTELCFKIKNKVNTSHIPVVLLTARTDESQIVEGYGVGADAYITKPFNIKLLIIFCNNMVNNRKILYQKFNNTSQQPVLFNSVSKESKELIDKTVEIIRANFSNPDFDMTKLGEELGLGRTKLYTSIKEITGFTPNEYTLNLKLQEATHLLDNEVDMNISDIAFHLGFSSSKYFSKCFKTFYGIVPQEWRKRKKEEM